MGTSQPTSFRRFRYELDPNNRQRTQLARHAGCARFVYNWGLARCIGLRQENGRTPELSELERELNLLKYTAYLWMNAVSLTVPREALRDLDTAFRRYYASRRTGTAHVGYLRFKSKGATRDRFRLTGAITAAGCLVKLPHLGRIRLKELVSALTGRIFSATVSREADPWFVSLLVAMPSQQTLMRQGPAVGVDLGIDNVAVISDEPNAIPGPRPLEAGLTKQRRLARAISRKQRGSRNQQKARLRLARHHRRVANVRRDFLFKLSTSLSREKATIVTETLVLPKLVRNHSLARHVRDAAWGTFVRQLEYKGLVNSCQVIRASILYPSTKRCSACGAIKAKVDLKQRAYSCEICGVVMDRDRNSARNLAQYVAASSAETLNACGEDVRPADCRQASLKQEPGSGPAGCHQSGRTVEPGTLHTSASWTGRSGAHIQI